MSAQPQTVYRRDYQAPEFRVQTVNLQFELGDTETLVHGTLTMERVSGASETLRLDGQQMALRAIAIDGTPLPDNRYTVDDEGLTLRDVPDRFQLAMTTAIRPQENTALEGLYQSSGMYCTQCEAEGFRRIIYFPDRPDVMATYTTTIVADAGRYPVLLSNGNLEDQGTLEDGRHWARWHDPHPKPSYLFALVAGDLHEYRDSYRTASGRDVTLSLYVEHRNAGKTRHGMESLKRAMRWDEETYGLEYDLDRYMIVAVDDFNMGAMENKGLNIFNTVCVLADERSSTDRDFETVEAVIAHEYFHNWTGNRVTCRDWFQLSLKEGLTVFREHQFCADMGSPDVKRIGEVRVLRAAQFPEDAGPMAHPVRPDAYVEISNFYTPTVYNKGAEVIRMYHTLLGAEGFRRGMDLYFRRHDGQAVTCDDFLAAMADANERDLSQFGRWYAYAGTPQLDVSDDYDASTGRYTLTVRQHTPPTPGQTEKPPLHIPLALGLLDPQGRELPLRPSPETASLMRDGIVELCEATHVLEFEDVPEHPTPSLLRGFSAPVKLQYNYSDDQLALILGHDSDGFTRWEAGQRLASNVMLRHLDDPDALTLPACLLTAFAQVLERAPEDPAFAAEALTLPTEQYLGEQQETVRVDANHAVREQLLLRLAEELEPRLRDVYQRGQAAPGDQSSDATAWRSLTNTCLSFLARLPGAGTALVAERYAHAGNMTDRLAALALLAREPEGPASQSALDAFYTEWKDDPLVVNKWFQVQAMAQHSGALERVRELAGHPAFSLRNPNRVRSLVSAFSQGNPTGFHRGDGAGYIFLADQVLELNALNPQIAARVLLPLTHWRRHDTARQKLMRGQLERIANEHKLSKDVYEVVSKSLQG
ncbi:MAG: aminopeptidase N [Ectothiorhodospiraceae bacterium]|nr:aminopeptidase N [Ectothiorhodospiraceae bacterium]MCH8504995.1 aminopeptidase N [Ectothiorhodospiraceae bacterium]